MSADDAVDGFSSGTVSAMNGGAVTAYRTKKLLQCVGRDWSNTGHCWIFAREGSMLNDPTAT